MGSGFLFIESEDFTQLAKSYFASDEEYAELQTFLIDRPEAGPVITGAPPLRKLRWKDTRRGKSKRGGLRLIYLWISDLRTFYMLDVYDKDEADDLSPAQKRELRAMAEFLVAELRAKAHRREP